MSRPTLFPPVTASARAKIAPQGRLRSPAYNGSNCPGEGKRYRLGPGVTRAVSAQPYRRRGSDPVYRPLRIFTLDPAVSRLEGSVAVVNVPYEPLKPGPAGALFKVDHYDEAQRLHYRQVDLDDPAVLICNGHAPSTSDPRFHQQMVYAVCSLVYAAFKRALGRDIAWGFDSTGGEPNLLFVRPHGCLERNAYYDKTRGELRFGYYRAEAKVAGRNLPGSYIFTCLSHDIIAHEVTHALLDGLRSHFMLPTGLDVLAFHEGFADLVAIFQHFSYEKVLESAIQTAHGQLEEATLLTDLARQFGHTTGSYQPLRSAIEVEGGQKYHQTNQEPHALGSLLTSAVFEAFVTLFKRKSARFLSLATGGSGLLPPGRLCPDLEKLLSQIASKLARQFLRICIRAIDYCPPIGLEFGEFLRAVITADCDLVPEDPWGYREAWIDAFQRRGIYPRHVTSLSEDALLWRPPVKRLSPIEALSFAQLAFDGCPGRPADAEELRRQACALGEFVSRPEHLDVFGLASPDDSRLQGDTVGLPTVESIRTSQRVGPHGQIMFDLIAEVIQRRTVRCHKSAFFDYYGGATVILDPIGQIRYVISKSVLAQERLAEQQEFILSQLGQRLWMVKQGKLVPNFGFSRIL